MKSVSIVLAVVLFSATVMMGFSNAQNTKCSDAVRGLMPCLPQIKTLNPADINSSCCAVISEMIDECPTYFQSFWVSRAHKICSAQDSQLKKPVSPPTQQPKPVSPPPQQSKPVSPPEDDGDQCDIGVMGPWMKELFEFGAGRNSTMSEGCCEALIGLQNGCGPAYPWSDAYIQCQDYCHSHYP